MKMSLDSVVGVSMFALIAGGFSGTAWAQDVRAADSEATGGDIIVTAQKRAQALIDVPISITAITGDTLARAGASTIEDLQYTVPGVSITQFSPGQQRIQIRGVSVYAGLPTVGVYMDEMPLNLETNQSGQDVRLLDIARVEVLRGPQGTLYGQGAVGGTLRYITNDVDLSRVEASAAGEVARIDSGGTDWKGEAMVNVPMVTDRLGLRVAGAYQRLGGWIDNPLLGDKNANAGHTLTLRAKLKMVFTDDFKLTLTAQHQELKVGAQNLSDGNEQIPNALPVPYESKSTLLNALATYDFGAVTLLSSSSYIHRKDFSVQDVTATFGPFFPLLFGVPPGTVQSAGLVGSPKYNVFSEELRLSSNGDGAFNWTVGGFYRQLRGQSTSTSVITPNILPPGFIFFGASGTSPENSKSWAVFGEASYRIADTLTALVGVRYFHDRRVQDATSAFLGSLAVDRGRANFHATSPRFNLSWQPNDQVNLYANIAKGFRSGGFNITSAGGGAAIPPSYDPDSIWTYEAGAKFQSADRKLSLELAGYRNIWKNVQTTTNVLGLPTSFTTNSGKISGWGVDGSVSYSPLRGLTVTLTGGWNNMEYKSNSAEHFAGDPVDYVPSFTGSASAEYRFDVAAMPSFIRVDYQHADRFQVFLRNFQPTPAHSDEQNILNARIGVSGEALSGALFVKNILNRDSVLYPAFAALAYPARLQPRTAGVAFSVKY